MMWKNECLGEEITYRDIFLISFSRSEISTNIGLGERVTSKNLALYIIYIWL